MTLSQRLTRAGLVFVLLGTVAAVLPNSDTVLANTTACTHPPRSFRLTTDPGGQNDTSTGTTFYAYAQTPPSSGTYTSTSATYSLSGSGGGSGTLSNTSGPSTTVTRTGTGSLLITATFGDGTIVTDTVS